MLRRSVARTWAGDGVPRAGAGLGSAAVCSLTVPAFSVLFMY